MSIINILGYRRFKKKLHVSGLLTFLFFMNLMRLLKEEGLSVRRCLWSRNNLKWCITVICSRAAPNASFLHLLSDLDLREKKSEYWSGDKTAGDWMCFLFPFCNTLWFEVLQLKKSCLLKDLKMSNSLFNQLNVHGFKSNAWRWSCWCFVVVLFNAQLVWVQEYIVQQVSSLQSGCECWGQTILLHYIIIIITPRSVDSAVDAGFFSSRLGW